MHARIVMLVDLDYFFAQCEELRDPTLKNKAVVIAMYSGRTAESGAVSTANYVARYHGVKSGIPLFLAKKRLEGVESVFLPVDFEYYEGISERIMRMLKSYADIFEQVGIDEAYLDVTRRASDNYDAARELAQQVRSEVMIQTQISSSAGIGPNKLVAKIACEIGKPNGLTVVTPSEVISFLHPLPVDRILGVGRKTAARLENLGVRTVGDLAGFDAQRLTEVFGRKLSIYFHNAANGVDDEPVEESGEAESISRIATLKANTRNLALVLDRCTELIHEIHKELVKKKLRFRQVGITAVLSDLTIRSRSKTFDQPSRDIETICRAVRELFEKFLAKSDLGVRRVGVRVSAFEKEELAQKQLTSFFTNQ